MVMACRHNGTHVLRAVNYSRDNGHCNTSRFPNRAPTCVAIQKVARMWRRFLEDDHFLSAQNGSFAQRKGLLEAK